MVATALIGSAIIGGGASIFAANKAAGAQTAAAGKATDAQLQMYHEAAARLQPYVDNGVSGENALMRAIPGLSAPIELSQDWLEKTPGYKFNLAQGLKGVYNSASARGLGASGAALKGAGAFTTGLADSTYQNQFNNALLNKQFTLQSLMAPVSIGENAAATSGNNAVNTGTNIGANMTGAGNASAAAWINSGNAIGKTGDSISNVLLAKQLGIF